MKNPVHRGTLQVETPTIAPVKSILVPEKFRRNRIRNYRQNMDPFLSLFVFVFYIYLFFKTLMRHASSLLSTGQLSLLIGSSIRAVRKQSLRP